MIELNYDRIINNPENDNILEYYKGDKKVMQRNYLTVGDLLNLLNNNLSQEKINLNSKVKISSMSGLYFITRVNCRNNDIELELVELVSNRPV